jgi:hypothetical protein
MDDTIDTTVGNDKARIEALLAESSTTHAFSASTFHHVPYTRPDSTIHSHERQIERLWKQNILGMKGFNANVRAKRTSKNGIPRTTYTSPHRLRKEKSDQREKSNPRTNMIDPSKKTTE